MRSVVELAPQALPGLETSVASPRAMMTEREIFEAYGRFIWRTLQCHGVGERDLEDVSQEVFLVIFRKLDQFALRSSARPWIYGICIRVAADYRRRAYVRREVLVGDLPEEGADSPTSDILALRRLFAMLQQLDEDKRIVVVLHELEQLPMDEVAAIVGCPRKTAYSRLAAAKKQLLETISTPPKATK